MEIKPIVFNVGPAAAPAAAPTTKPSLVPWIIVAGLAIALLVLSVRTFDGGVTPAPRPVVNEVVAETARKDSRTYLLEVAKVFDSLADKVESRAITNDTQLQSNSRAATAAARDVAYAATNELDNANVRGDYTGREAAVAAHLRSKAEGYRRAAK